MNKKKYTHKDYPISEKYPETVKAKSSYEKTSKNKENLDKNVEPEVKKNKSFKMDKSFLKND